MSNNYSILFKDIYIELFIRHSNDISEIPHTRAYARDLMLVAHVGYHTVPRARVSDGSPPNKN